MPAPTLGNTKQTQREDCWISASMTSLKNVFGKPWFDQWYDSTNGIVKFMDGTNVYLSSSARNKPKDSFEATVRAVRAYYPKQQCKCGTGESVYQKIDDPEKIVSSSPHLVYQLFTSRKCIPTLLIKTEEIVPHRMFFKNISLDEFKRNLDSKETIKILIHSKNKKHALAYVSHDNVKNTVLVINSSVGHFVNIPTEDLFGLHTVQKDLFSN